jgi:hypothetical protein
MAVHDTPGGSDRHLKERLREELRKYLIVSVYLYICFVAILLYKASLLSEEGLHYLPFGLAAAKALIIGKFLLIGESVGVGSRIAVPTLLHRIAYRVMLLFILVVALSIAEELVVGWLHHHSVAQTIDELRQKYLPEKLATWLLILLILIPLVAFAEISRALGPGALGRLLKSRPDGREAP